jgi:hypothetical protein
MYEKNIYIRNLKHSSDAVPKFSGFGHIEIYQDNETHSCLSNIMKCVHEEMHYTYYSNYSFMVSVCPAISYVG